MENEINLPHDSPEEKIDLVDRLIKRARTTRRLNLSRCSLDTIPPQVFEITSLAELDLSFNNIKIIPPEVKRLANLRILDLSTNRLESVPLELGILKNLNDLRISCNSSLPKEILMAHFNGLFLEKLKEDYLHKRKGIKKVADPLPNQRRVSKVQSLIDITTRRDSKSNKLNRNSSISSFTFTQLMGKKVPKEVKEKVKNWKKSLGSLQLADEIRFRGKSARERLELEILQNDQMKVRDKWTQPTRTYKGHYNLANPCAIRAVHVKKEEKVHFYQQVSAASEINHSNVNKLFGVVKYSKKKVKFKNEPEGFSSGTPPFLVATEFLVQGNLLEWLHSNYADAIALKKKLQLAKQIAQGMQCLHACNPMIIHHNLRPSNVLFSDDSKALVSDYYLGNRFLKEYQPSNIDSVSKPQQILKEHQCLSVNRGSTGSDEESDVFSTRMRRAATLYESSRSFNSSPTSSRNSLRSSMLSESPEMKHKREHSNQGIPTKPFETEEKKEEEIDIESLRAISKPLPIWMAPEILRQENYTEKVDVYSFGMLLFELVTRITPFSQVKTLEELINIVAVNDQRPVIPQHLNLPKSLVDLITACWHSDPDRRPTFVQIVNHFDDIIVDCLVNDELAQTVWKQEFRGQESVEWSEFIAEFFDFFKEKSPQGNQGETVLRSLHDVIVDGNEMVTLENFSKMTQWFGPMDGIGIITRIYEMQMRSWFHGSLSSVQAEDILSEKAKGTFLIRFSASNPGSFAISVLNEEGQIKHYKVLHQPGNSYQLGKEEFPNMEALIKESRDLLYLKFPCQKEERYSDSNFWVNHTYDEEDCKTVISLKKLCFRFIFRNSQLFPRLKEVMPMDLIEEYYSTIVDSITSDEAGRTMWKVSFLGEDAIPWNQFAASLYKFLKIQANETTHEMLHAILADIADNRDDLVTIETFSKLLEWFGPFGESLLEKVFEIVSKNWFHGNMSHLQAERWIQKNSNAKKGTFLIRFSSKNRGYFTITVVGRKKSLLHYRVYYNRNTLEYMLGKRVFRTLDEIIGTFHRELCLRYPCPGSKFQLLQPQ